MKILITGANGQLGNEIVSILKDKQSDIGAIDEAYKGAEIIAADVDMLDITDYSSVEKFLNEKAPDIIINCAAMTDVDGCESKLELAMKVNAVGPRNLSIASKKIGSKLVHVSTDYVFAGDAEFPYCEWDVCNPQSVYGKSKLLGEFYVKEFCEKYFIFRTSWLYGFVGNNFVKTMLKLGKEKDQIKVVDDQRGNPTNANDLAHNILKVALTNEFGVYHCTGEGECSWCDFAAKIMEYSKCSCKVLPCRTDEFPKIAKRPAFSSLNNLMLKCTMGNEMRQWEVALKSYLDKLLGE